MSPPGGGLLYIYFFLGGQASESSVFNPFGGAFIITVFVVVVFSGVFSVTGMIFVQE